MANYFATVVSKEAYTQLDDLVYRKLVAWATHRHPKKSKAWVSKKYWQSMGGDNWVFATRKEGTSPLRYEELASLIEAHRTAPQMVLIRNLNPKIRGWANYYSSVVSKEIFSHKVQSRSCCVFLGFFSTP
jgi:hypothetical protein